MEGFTIGKMDRFLDSGRIVGDQKSIPIRNENFDSSSEISSNLVGENSSATETQKSFKTTLSDAIHSVNELQLKADKSAQELAVGRTDNIADVMLATEKADIALRLMIQVRNKIIDTYQEIMKMQV